MSITQGKSAQNLRKSFQVTGEWNEQLASKINDYMDTLTATFPSLRYGRYTGNGEVKTVNFAPAIGPPLVVLMANEDTGVGDIVLVPVSTGPITAWSKTGFTLDSTAAVNTLNANYQFVVLLQPTE
jgi:hypothetical protein